MLTRPASWCRAWAPYARNSRRASVTSPSKSRALNRGPPQAQSQGRISQPELAAADTAPEPPRAGRGSDTFSGGRDAWSRWHRGGGGGPGGPGGGGGGPDGGDDDNAEHFGFSDLTQDRPGAGRKPLTKYCKSPFDTKDATLGLPRFNGKTGREMWRKRVTFYLHSKNPDMMGLLRWAEREREPVTAKTLAAARRASPHLARISEDPEVLSYHLWGFLNANLIEDAKAIFAGADMENGLDVWRASVLATTQKSQAEVLRLEDSILLPERIRNATDIEKALVEWDAMCREHIEASGSAVSKHRKVGVLMRMLPPSLHEDVLKEFNEFDEQPEALRRWIRDRVQWLKWSDASSRKHHLLEGDEGDKRSDNVDSAFSAELDALVKNGTANDEEVCAFVRRKFSERKPERGRSATRPERERPARSKADTTCPNCIQKEHTGQEFTKPKIDVKDRACFNCGKPGILRHVAQKARPSSKP